MNSGKFSDEIDLFQVFLKTIKIIKNNSILILSSFLMGTLLGFLWYSTTPTVFESKMLISSEILTESYTTELIDNLNLLISENNLADFSKKINLSESDSRALKRIEIENANNKPESLKENEKIFLIISVSITDLAILPKLQNKLIQYLENNNFVHIRVEQKRNFLTAIIKKTKEEIDALEEFKKKISDGDFFASTKGNIMFDPTTVNTKILDLTKEKISYENTLQLVNSVQIVEGFTAFHRPVSPKLSISLISGSMVGIFFVIFIISFKTIRKIIRLEEVKNE